MFKKVMSLALASTLVLSAGAFAASAAEAEEAVAANDESVVSADDSSAVAADDESQVGANPTIYFDTKSAGWNNFKTVFCHVWKADGTGTWPDWQLRPERCTDEGNGIYAYDLTKTKNDIKPSDGKLYCVIFSADTGVQTYNTIMSGSCIGDTLYCKSKEQIENPKDNNKKCYLAEWKNNTDCGPQKVINSSGGIFGTALAEGTTDVTLMADYLIEYVSEDGVADTGKTDKTQDLINQLKISPVDVMANVKYKNAEAVSAGTLKQEAADKKNATIEGILANCTDPTNNGQKVDKDQLDKTEAKNDADKSGSSSNGGSSSSGDNNSNSSSSNGSSSSGSNSVQSGQETTIFFVFGGVMLTAAGVMFLVRRRED